MGKMQRTKLVWDDYIDYLIDAINGSKFMKRAEDKPMSTPKLADESHVTTRAIHLREAADIAKRLAKGLGLNEDYIYTAMLMHDAGHPFSGHEGEEIFNQLGEIYDTQYFHHNAKGIEIILSEDLCGKAISKIPNISNKPELKKQLEDEFWYFLDAIISHDGEANQTDMMRAEEKYETIEQAVREKIKSANSVNKYKFTAQTPEGKIAKFADVIAYLSSDMQDGFRLKILNNFSDNYLELFGEMFSPEYPVTREDKIECGRRIIEQIKEQHLREKKETMGFVERQEEDLKDAIVNIGRKMSEKNLNVFEKMHFDQIREIFEEEKNAYKQKKLAEFFSSKGANIPEEERADLEQKILQKSKKRVPLDGIEKEFARTISKIHTDSSKIEEFAYKMLRARSSVVYDVTSKMKEFFINDLIANSQNADTPQLSNKGWDLFFKAKKLNYQEFVIHTNWDYQTECLPQSAKELVEECAATLLRSGEIRNKFYDEAVRQYVTDPEALEYMETRYRDENKYESYREKIGIGDLKAHIKAAQDKDIEETQDKDTKEIQDEDIEEAQDKDIKAIQDEDIEAAQDKDTKAAQDEDIRKKEEEIRQKNKLARGLYSYVQNENEVFAMRYENTFKAIPVRVRKKIEKALSDDYKVDQKHLYKDKMQQQINLIRQEARELYGTTELTPEQKEEFIQRKIAEGLDGMERKMAVQLASDYLAGMTDRSFVDVAIKTNHLDPKVLENAVRGTIKSGNVAQLIGQISKTGNTPNTPNTQNASNGISVSEGISQDDGDGR